MLEKRESGRTRIANDVDRRCRALCASDIRCRPRSRSFCYRRELVEFGLFFIFSIRRAPRGLNFGGGGGTDHGLLILIRAPSDGSPGSCIIYARVHSPNEHAGARNVIVIDYTFVRATGTDGRTRRARSLIRRRSAELAKIARRTPSIQYTIAIATSCIHSFSDEFNPRRSDLRVFTANPDENKTITLHRGKVNVDKYCRNPRLSVKNSRIVYRRIPSCLRIFSCCDFSNILSSRDDNFFFFFQLYPRRAMKTIKTKTSYIFAKFSK